MDINQLFEFLTNHWILSLLLVAILVALSIEPLLRRLRGIKKVSAIETTRLINTEDARVIDIREDKEFLKEHMLDSFNVPMANFLSRIKTLDELKGDPLILVWTTGQQAMWAAGQLRKQGHKRVYVLQGGIESWREAKMPLFSGHTKAKPKPRANLQSKPGEQPEAGMQPQTSVQSEAGTQEAGTQSEVDTQPESGTQPEADTQPQTSAQSETGTRPQTRAQPKGSQSKPGARSKSRGGKKAKSRKKARPAKKTRRN